MKKMILAVLMLGAAITTAHAQTKEYYTELVEGPQSRSSCPKVFSAYSVTVSAGTVSIAAAVGKLFSGPLESTGIFRSGVFRSPAGGNVEFWGDTTKGEYTMYNASNICLYRFVPKNSGQQAQGR